MAVNKNFVVKNGLEVASNAVLVDGSSKNVGIGSTQPTKTLDVRGGIGATDILVTGVSTFISDVQVGASGSVFYASNLLNNVGVGTSLPAYTLDVRGPVSTGTTALYVFGDMHVTGDINLDDTSLDQLFVAGISTLVGYSTFRDYVFIQDGLQVAGAGLTATTINSGVSTFTGNVDINSFADISGTLNVSGITTLAGSGGITTTGGDLYVGRDLYVQDDVVYDEVTGRRINVSTAITTKDFLATGIATVGTAITMYGSSGIVSATAFHGDGANLTNITATSGGTIGVGSEGTFIGAGITMVDFKSSNASNTVLVDGTSGIATVTVTTGVSIGLAIALGG